jgi:hypothetical protein
VPEVSARLSLSCADWHVETDNDLNCWNQQHLLKERRAFFSVNVLLDYQGKARRQEFLKATLEIQCVIWLEIGSMRVLGLSYLTLTICLTQEEFSRGEDKGIGKRNGFVSSGLL